MCTSEKISPSLSFNNILFGLDFSPGSLVALPFAVEVAAHYRSKLFISHISAGDEDRELSPLSRARLEKLECGAEAGLLGTLRALEISHEFLFDCGSICSTLAAIAEERNVDLIIIGTHGWRGIKKFLKGSTAEEIMYLAARPVLTVGPRVESQPEFKRILYATNVLHAEALALLYAFSFAHAFGASVSMLYVEDSEGEEPAAKAALHSSSFLRDQLRDYAYGAAAERAEAVVEFGPLSERILQFAAARRADLIVMGLRQSEKMRARIAAHLPGSTTYEVISQAHCPVLTVPLAMQST